jgi:hypothetical protein
MIDLAVVIFVCDKLRFEWIIWMIAARWVIDYVSDFSCHLYTIKEQEDDDRLNFKSSKTISLINLCLKSRKRLFHSKLSFVIVSHSSCCLVSDLHSLCRVRIIEWSVQILKRSSLLSNDLKTIKSFVKWSQNDQVFSDRTFWILSHVWSFYFVFNSCTRKRHSAAIEDIIRNVMMIDDDDQRMMWRFVFFSKQKCFHTFRSHDSIFLFSSSFYVLFIVIIISCLSRWNYCAICFWELSVVRSFMHSWKCFVSYYQSFFISVFLEKSTSSSFAWASLRCLNCSSSFVARKYLNILAINSKVSKSVNKFVSRLFAHIFFRRSSNFEHFNNVWCIVCLRTSHEHRENSIVFILWR